LIVAPSSALAGPPHPTRTQIARIPAITLAGDQRAREVPKPFSGEFSRSDQARRLLRDCQRL
jgi:hypothetical protein